MRETLPGYRDTMAQHIVPSAGTVQVAGTGAPSAFGGGVLILGLSFNAQFRLTKSLVRRRLIQTRLKLFGLGSGKGQKELIAIGMFVRKLSIGRRSARRGCSSAGLLEHAGYVLETLDQSPTTIIELLRAIQVLTGVK
jgi:hypothetical protein